MKKLALVALVVGILFSMVCGKDFDKEFEGKWDSIQWESVNLREEPNGEVICELQRGTIVTLTGNKYETLDMGDLSTWVEVRVDSSDEELTGWLVLAAMPDLEQELQ